MAGSRYFVFHPGALRLLNAAHNWATADHYSALLVNFVPDLKDDTWSDILADEIGDADYSPEDLTGEAVTESGGLIKYDATDISFGNPVTISATFAAIMEGLASGQTGTDKLVGITALNLDTTLNPSAAAAVNKGGGKVGIPVTAHGLSTSNTILIKGTVNYDGFFAVDSDSTTNEIVITSPFSSETFTGSETINRCLASSSTTGPFTVQISANGLTKVDFTVKGQ